MLSQETLDALDARRQADHETPYEHKQIWALIICCLMTPESPDFPASAAALAEAMDDSYWH